MKKIFYLVTLFPLMLFSQGRIILNGGTINLQNGAHIVIQNSNPNAITILDSSSGIVINDASGILRWNIGSTSGNYYIPFKHTSSLIPIRFATSNAVGTGYFDLSTYHVPNWKNSDHLPKIINNVNSNGSDNSHRLLDRFWLIHAQGYITKPEVTNLSFGYTDTEWNASGNMISESMLKAQRWNSNLNTWSDYAPSGYANTVNNQVNVSSVSTDDLFEWWTLVDADYPLNDDPIGGSKMVDRGESLFNSQSINKSGIRIYPNPVINTLTIHPGVSGARELWIIDVTGRKVHQQLITDNIENINLSYLLAGTYIVQLMKGEIKWSVKVVKL